MLEHSIYSVISPEGAASILWRDSTRAKEAATNMKITAEDLKSLGVIDGIIPEPLGGAHREPGTVIKATGDVIATALGEFTGRTGEQIRNERRQKFLAMGRNL
jgi:acetyl-CoA carboxylase carboxyl transferase subunit alpha